ncbi:hypothetical protein RB195_016623 [Necator americanus]|uniref:Uncharacterized protein n=1 Tax=Necator americanus TaxID=51031 RepID=A0ABR1C4M8_NECAM
MARFACDGRASECDVAAVAQRRFNIAMASASDERRELGRQEFADFGQISVTVGYVSASLRENCQKELDAHGT